MQWVTTEFNMFWLGLFLFFFVPFLLWLFSVAFIRRKSVSDKFFVFIAGSDNRLSLSRLQAFLWTLVIFGSFFAAMAVHKSINPNTQAEADTAKIEAETAAKKVETIKTELDLIKTKADNATKEKKKADDDYTKAQTTSNGFTDKTTPQAIQAAAEVDQKKSALDAKTNQENAANTALGNAQTTFSDAGKFAQTDREIADIKAEQARKENWVVIPAALLALAGIAIGAGVFSSLISALNKEEKTACITGIEEIKAEFFNKDKTIYKDTVFTDSDNLLRITGIDLGSSGKVRLGKGKAFSVYVPILFWKSDGSEIIVDVPPNGSYDTLVVDTPNGKLSHELKDLTTAQLNARKAPLDTELQKAKKDAQDIEKAKQAKDDNLSAVQANLKTLTESGTATPSDIQKAEKVVADVQKEANDLAARLSEAQTAVANLQVETSNLRLGDVSNMELGIFTYYYELSDLFRDDKNPSNMDLMKFQMFGWTVIAIFIYSWLFVSNLGNDITSLPIVPESIVILTGLSQAGYLAGKGVSSVEGNKKEGT